MSATLQNGARFQLRKQRLEEAGVHYLVEIELPGEQCYEFAVTVAIESGDFDIQLHAGRPLPEGGEWAGAHLNAIVLQMVRKARTSGRWPRRLKYWKAAP